NEASMDKLALVCSFLLLSAAFVNSGHNDNLWEAAKGGNLDDLNKALDDGADPNWREDNLGTAALHVASLFDHPNVVKPLLDAGADINQQDDSGRTPVYLASSKGSIHMTSELIEHGADVNIMTNYGSTPLLIATQGGHIDIVEALIKAQADVNLPDNQLGITALHLAAMINNTEIAQLLLRNGAEPKKLDNDGKTPGDYARNKENYSLAKIIDNFTAFAYTYTVTTILITIILTQLAHIHVLLIVRRISKN
ncbi:unnamed protein product, partial [Meganyctiphanes norvegica]